MKPIMEIRGIRNHNPGNIRHGDKWLGLADNQTDKSFCVFTSPEYGIRAMARVLHNYFIRHGLTTVREIIDRWAPPIENDTDSYINSVSYALGVTPDARLYVPDRMTTLVKAIIVHENGVQPYSDVIISRGVEMALRGR